MTTLYSHKRIMGVALALLASGLANTVEAQPTGAGGLVAHYVARIYIDPATGQAQCVGYFTNIAGITASLFNGTPGEETAYFTFRSDVSTVAIAGQWRLAARSVHRWQLRDLLQSSADRRLGPSGFLFERPADRDVQAAGKFRLAISAELPFCYPRRAGVDASPPFQRTQLRFQRHRTRRPDSHGRWQHHAVAGDQRRLFARPPVCRFGDCRRRRLLNSATPDAPAVLDGELNVHAVSGADNSRVGLVNRETHPALSRRKQEDGFARLNASYRYWAARDAWKAGTSARSGRAIGCGHQRSSHSANTSVN